MEKEMRSEKRGGREEEDGGSEKKRIRVVPEAIDASASAATPTIDASAATPTILASATTPTIDASAATPEKVPILASAATPTIDASASAATPEKVPILASAATPEKVVEDWPCSMICYLAFDLKDDVFRSQMTAVLNSIASDDDSLMRTAVLVRGVSPSCSREALLDHFLAYGPVNDCLISNYRPGSARRNVALILFQTQAGALAAVQNPTRTIHGALTHSQFVVPGGRLPPPKPHPSDTLVFLRQLSSDPLPTPRDLDREFLKYGDLAFGPALHAMPPAFSYLIYRTPEGAKAAVQDPFKTVAGCRLHCTSTTAEVLKAATYKASSIMEAVRSQALDDLSYFSSSSTPHPPNTTLYVTHVPYDCPPRKLKELLFLSGQIAAGPIKIDVGFALEWDVYLVVYTSPEGAQIALQDPNKLLLGNHIHCTTDTLAVELEAEQFVHRTLKASFRMIQFQQYGY